MFKPNFLSLLSVIFFALTTKAQDFPKNYFASPMDIPLQLSANFGELRSNHFHTGIDIKTQEKEGLTIRAAADGFVSRIKIAANGYGNIIYIAHPNGYTTAYAHLKAFAPKIEQVATEKQFKDQSFEVDFAPAEGAIKVKKGEFIGLSGNSGSSGGPHLHFEIRETKSEKACNPLLFGFAVQDNIKPQLFGVNLYALGENSNVNGKQSQSLNLALNQGVYQAAGRTVKERIKQKNGKYKTLTKSLAAEPITAFGDIGLAVHATDKLNNNANVCGIYSIETYVDDAMTHSTFINAIDFSQNRALNAHTDYEQFKFQKKNIHKCFIEPGNKLDIYPFSKNRGLININDLGTHQVRIVVCDAYGNEAKAEFAIKGNGFISDNTLKPSINERLLNFDKKFTEKTTSYAIDFPAYNVYRNCLIPLNTTSGNGTVYSTVLSFGNPKIPVHGLYELKLAANGLSADKKKYAYLAELNERLTPIGFVSTQQEDNFFKGKSKSFGIFGIVLDMEPPTIRSLSLGKLTTFKDGTQLKFSGGDSGSGLRSYNIYIDGVWQVLSYDAKYKVFAYSIDSKRIGLGSHQLRVELTDNVGNSKEFTSSFTVN